MDLLRRPIPVPDVVRLLHFQVAKSTVQDYKKHGPPWFRRYSKTSSVESYPASLQEENEFLKKAIQAVLQQAKQAIDQGNTANKKVADLTVIKNLNESKIETQNQEKEELQKMVDKQKDEKIKMIQDHQRELEEQKTKIIQEKVQEISKIDKAYHDTLRNFDERLTPYIAEHNDLRNENVGLKQENSDLKQKVQTLEETVQGLKEELKNAPIKYGGIGLGIGAGLGVIGVLSYQHFFGKKSNLLSPQSNASMIIPILQSIQKPLDTTTSGTSCSGFNNYPGNTGVEDNDIFIQPEIVIPGIQDVISGITPDSSTVSPGIISGYAIAPIQQDGINQSPVTNSAVSSSGSFPIYVPSVQLTPPSNPSDSYILQQYYQTSGRGFEVTMKEFFEPPYQNNDVELTPASHDGGKDLIVRPRFGGSDITVVEVKLWKEKKVGPDVIDKTFKAMKDHKANHALVITTGEFTKPALERAKELGVECWDWKRLLEEIYKHRFFKTPT